MTHYPFLRRILVFAVVASLNVLPAPGIAASNVMQVAVRDGCANSWMFNGIWRVRVIGYAPHMVDSQQNGWDVTEQWRNGTDQTLAPGPGTFTTGQQLVLQNGDVIGAWDTTTGTLSQQIVDYHDFPPSAQYTQTQTFYANASDPNNKPVEVIIAFDAAKLAQIENRPHFTANPPNYRIKFSCTPTELAKAVKAQGGSFEVAAHEGCIDKSVSDGIWRVRVSKITTAIDAGTNLPNGWDVTEDWVNATGRKMTPNDSFVLDQQLVLQNGDTISSANWTTTTLTAQKLDYHEFAPNVSFTHVQPFRLFRQTYDPANKPVKLLLLFDAKQFKLVPEKPQYSKPSPNIRIGLDCAK